MTYYITSLAEDEETQRRGVVNIIYFVHDKVASKFDNDVESRGMNMIKWIPLRVCVIHFCTDDPRMRFLKIFSLGLFDRYAKTRFRVHDGTHTEIQYHLMGFGIPINSLPITFSGEIKTNEHNKWIARRKAKDTQLKLGLPFEGTDLPGLHDVLLGRGKVVNEHRGNIRVRSLVDMYREEYDDAPLGEKRLIAERIVRAIQKDLGRFLKQASDGWWHVVDDSEAIKKVSSVFRTERSLRRRTTKTTTEPSEIKRSRTEEVDKPFVFALPVICGSGDYVTAVTS